MTCFLGVSKNYSLRHYKEVQVQWAGTDTSWQFRAVYKLYKLYKVNCSAKREKLQVPCIQKNITQIMMPASTLVAMKVINICFPRWKGRIFQILSQISIYYGLVIGHNYLRYWEVSHSFSYVCLTYMLINLCVICNTCRVMLDKINNISRIRRMKHFTLQQSILKNTEVPVCFHICIKNVVRRKENVVTG